LITINCIAEKGTPSFFNCVWVTVDGPGYISDNSASVSKIIDLNNQFALDFYSEISDTEGNLFFSPTSIDAVFAIVYEGAQGETTKNMEETFGFTKDDIQRREQYKKLIDILNKKDSRYSLNTANALWM
jgi:serpin B